MAGPTGDGEHNPGESLDDDAVAARWAELTSSLGELRMPASDDAAGVPQAAAAPTPPPGPRDYSSEPLDEDDDDPGAGIDGFVPPEPEPLTHADPALTLGWVATVGSVLVGIVLAVVWHPLPSGVLGGLGLILLAGVALLLWRMPDHRDDHSDGAVV
ncbi:hypothetical protein [Georgenia sp. SYP-B2076]|uniref:hypothetical protein n=1 Tax=Georgenia sp. SYP-B2076 TaxID=2495881 RepID=UPI000F8D4268|nr:hypothetical protein [Georgenia sp. SYP-B2076]